MARHSRAHATAISTESHSRSSCFRSWRRLVPDSSGMIPDKTWGFAEKCCTRNGGASSPYKDSARDFIASVDSVGRISACPLCTGSLLVTVDALVERSHRLADTHDCSADGEGVECRSGVTKVIQDIVRIVGLQLQVADAFEADRFEVSSIRDHGTLLDVSFTGSSAGIDGHLAGNTDGPAGGFRPLHARREYLDHLNQKVKVDEKVWQQRTECLPGGHGSNELACGSLWCGA